MKYYFIDFENVHESVFTNLKHLSKGDMIYTFYTKTLSKISLDIIEGFNQKEVSFRALQVNTGTKDALDFQLASYLGFKVSESGTGAEYYIVSKDTGYDVLCDFWVKKGFVVERIVDLSGSKVVDASDTKSSVKTKKKSKKVNKKSVVVISAEELLTCISQDEYPDKVLKILNEYKTKQAINIQLSKLFKDSQKSSSVYRKLKPLLKKAEKK